MSESIITTHNIDALDTISERLTQARAMLDVLVTTGSGGALDFPVPHSTVMATLWGIQALLDQADGALAQA